MTLLKIEIKDRNYENWQIINNNTKEEIYIDNFVPSQYKLCNNDIFIYNKGKVEIQVSEIREKSYLTGILILENNKTYGREKKEKGKIGKLLYKVIPNDISLPFCLIPYEINNLGFDKNIKNQFVTFKWKHWIEKHPIVSMVQLIGTVDDIKNYGIYQLYCKYIYYSSLSLQKIIKYQLKECNIDKRIDSIQIKNNIENREEWNIFSIDPVNCLDIDDAVSIKVIENRCYLLSIYIANVPLIIDNLCIWDHILDKSTSIYFPNSKISMLPTILSDNICSLRENEKRLAFVLDIIVDENGSIISTNFINCVIKVKKNYIYEESSLNKNNDYRLINKIVKNIHKNYPYISEIKDSHDVVSYIMVLMNYICAKDLFKFKNGIFRTILEKDKKKIDDNLKINIPHEIKDFINIWKNTSGSYTVIDNNLEQKLSHNLLKLDVYIHVTSPIRRIVDIINLIQIQENNYMFKFNKEVENFKENWINKINIINQDNKYIKKIQSDCELLYMCRNDKKILSKEYEGYCISKDIIKEKLNYNIYVPELKIILNLKRKTEEKESEFEIYHKGLYKIYLFNNENKFKQKVRLDKIN
jgi:exoribonuclease R